MTVGTSANGSISGIISLPDSSMLVTIIGNGRIFKSPLGDLTPFTAVNDSSLFPKQNLGRVLIANCRNVPNTVYAFFTLNEYLQKTFAGFFKSIDGGNTWIKPSSEITDVGSAQQMYCQMLGVHPTNPNYVMIGAVSTKFSRNGGINWTGFDPGHADNHVAIPAPDSVLLAATAFGLYYTTNNGKTWIKETRIPNVAIFEMKLRASDKNLFLFTHGRGVWHIELADLKSISPSKDINPIAFKIYPNPTNDILTIDSNFDINNIQIFDLTGKEILQQSNTQQINVSLLPKGVYLLKVFDFNGKFNVQKFIKQ